MTGRVRVPLALLAHDVASERIYGSWLTRLAELASAAVVRLDADPAGAVEALRRLPPGVPTVYLVASPALPAALDLMDRSPSPPDLAVVLDTGPWPEPAAPGPAQGAGLLRVAVFTQELDHATGRADAFATADVQIRLLPRLGEAVMETGSAVPELLAAILRTEVINAIGPPDGWPDEEERP